MGNLCSRPSTLHSRATAGGDYIMVQEAGPGVRPAAPAYRLGLQHGRPSPIATPTAPMHGTGQNTPTTTTNTSNSGVDRGAAAPHTGLAAHVEGQQPLPPNHGPLAPAVPAAVTPAPGPATPAGEHGAELAPAADAAAAPDAAPAAPFAWQRGDEIGSGAFGTVYKGLVYATGQEIAVKQVSLPRDAAQRGKAYEHIRALEGEVDVLRDLLHENIVRYLGTERTAEHLNIFLEYVPGGSLNRKVLQWGPLHEDTIRVYTKQILRGLQYLHRMRIMHRDIKGANILVDANGVVKLADFGASKKIEDLATMGGGSRSIRGTPNWMAPEVIKQNGHGRSADIWSLGCVIIEMSTGKPPWSNFTDPFTVMYHIASTRDLPAMSNSLSAQARDFLSLCFNRVPHERPNATRLLQHPWMQGVTVPRPAGPPPSLLPAPLPPPAVASAPQPAHAQQQQQHQQQQQQAALQAQMRAQARAGMPPLPPPPQQQQHQQQQAAMMQQQQQQHMAHPALGLRSPPSPIKEESESSRYGSPATVNTTASTPNTARTAILNAAAAANSGYPSVVSPPPPLHRPPVPPLPLDAMKMGMLPHGGAASAGVSPGPGVAGTGLEAQYGAAPKQQFPPAGPPPKAPLYAQPPPQQQQPAQQQKQYDTVMDSEAVRQQLLRLQQQYHHQHGGTMGASDASVIGIGMTMGFPGGGEGATVSMPAPPPMGATLGLGAGPQHGGGGAGAYSTLRLSGYNPIEEPSWMPGAGQQAFFQRLAEQSPGPGSSGSSCGGAPSLHEAPPAATPTAAPPAAAALLPPADKEKAPDTARSDRDNGGQRDAAAAPAGPIDSARLAGALPPGVPAHVLGGGAVATGVSPSSGANTQRGTARGKPPLAPQRPALADIFAAPEVADTTVEPDQPSPAATMDSKAGAAAWSPQSGASLQQQPRKAPAAATQQQQQAADSGAPRVSASRRALEEAGMLGGTLDPARAKQWRDELMAELQAERARAGPGLKAARESLAVSSGAPQAPPPVMVQGPRMGPASARPSVADL